MLNTRQQKAAKLLLMLLMMMLLMRSPACQAWSLVILRLPKETSRTRSKGQRLLLRPPKSQ
jgi:hypothetical protein